MVRVQGSRSGSDSRSGSGSRSWSGSLRKTKRTRANKGFGILVYFRRLEIYTNYCTPPRLSRLQALRYMKVTVYIALKYRNYTVTIP